MLDIAKEKEIKGIAKRVHEEVTEREPSWNVSYKRCEELAKEYIKYSEEMEKRKYQFPTK